MSRFEDEADNQLYRQVAETVGVSVDELDRRIRIKYLAEYRVDQKWQTKGAPPRRRPELTPEITDADDLFVLLQTVGKRAQEAEALGAEIMETAGQDFYTKLSDLCKSFDLDTWGETIVGIVLAAHNKEDVAIFNDFMDRALENLKAIRASHERIANRIRLLAEHCTLPEGRRSAIVAEIETALDVSDAVKALRYISDMPKSSL